MSEQHEFLAPARGLLCVHNHAGHPYRVRDLSRWLHLLAGQGRLRKVDLLDCSLDIPRLQVLLKDAAGLRLPLSLRTTGELSPINLELLANQGLFDVVISPAHFDKERMEPWIKQCRDNGLPLRIEIALSEWRAFREAFPPSTLSDHGVCVVSLFATRYVPGPIHEGTEWEGDVDSDALLKLRAEMEEAGIEFNLFGVPLCLLDDALWPNAGGAARHATDFQQYECASLALATRIHELSPSATSVYIMVRRLQAASLSHTMDRHVAEWLHLHQRSWVYRLALFSRRLLHDKRIISRAALEDEALALPENLPSLPAECLGCGVASACGGPSQALGSQGNAFKPTPISHVHVSAPFQMLLKQRKHYDVVDGARVAAAPGRTALVEEALKLLTGREPTRRCTSLDYVGVDLVNYPMANSRRWHGWSHTEKRSNVFTRCVAPVLLAFDMGGGLCDGAGFFLSDTFHVIVPVLNPSHEIALYIASDGTYVLLRDRQPVQPLTFASGCITPGALPTHLDVRLSLWNIQEFLLTQEVRIYEPDQESAAEIPDPSYTVIVFCSGFSRRLEAMLETLARQRGYDLSRVEVVVAYIPGLDATHDVLESFAVVHPQLRIVRRPFPHTWHHEKGRVINHCIRLARTDWIVLLDADILVPPDFFQQLETACPGASFIVPEGRHMLSNEATARILLGEQRSWEDWQGLLEGATEYRHQESEGVPIGFCQVFKKSCHNQVQYLEQDNFEGADYYFGIDMEKTFGPAKRLRALDVAHLEHGGSQWYGVKNQR